MAYTKRGNWRWVAVLIIVVLSLGSGVLYTIRINSDKQLAVKTNSEYSRAWYSRLEQISEGLARFEEIHGHFPRHKRELIDFDNSFASLYGPIPHAVEPVEIWLDLLGGEDRVLVVPEPLYLLPSNETARPAGLRPLGLFSDLTIDEYSQVDVLTGR